MIQAEIICDSINPCGNRLTTYILTYPRWVHAEFLRHRSVSNCVSSSRAIPVSRVLKNVWSDPLYPIYWGANQAGMQASSEVLNHQKWLAKKVIGAHRLASIATSWLLSKLNLHKQTANRYTEVHSNIVQLAAATDWGNFFNLRCDKMAQPEIMDLAFKMVEAYDKSIPKQLRANEYHLLFGDKYHEGLTLEEKIKVSVARSARASYSTFDGDFSKEKDFQLYERLLASRHYSPFEFPAIVLDDPVRHGNYVGFKQVRKTLLGENQMEFDTKKLLSLKYQIYNEMYCRNPV